VAVDVGGDGGGGLGFEGWAGGGAEDEVEGGPVGDFFLFCGEVDGADLEHGLGGGGVGVGGCICWMWVLSYTDTRVMWRVVTTRVSDCVVCSWA